jgi:hypothetical protein
MMVTALWMILLQVKPEITTNTWSAVLTQIVITVSISVILLFVANLLKPIFTRTDERFKNFEDRLNQGEKERDEIRKDVQKIREIQKDDKAEILRAIDKIGYQYSELMRVFQTVEADSKQEKEYLKKLIDMLQTREK